MNPGHKLTIGALVIAAAIGYLAYVGASNSWQYYLSVDETVADAARLIGRRVRVSGRVAAGSLSISEGRRDAEFELVGAQRRLWVTCHCTMPDNLAEEIEVVVEGRLEDGRLDGHKVITRCASKYVPKELVADQVASTGRAQQR
jgi:cytochrome c-type biogenesis protein CcmE